MNKQLVEQLKSMQAEGLLRPVDAPWMYEDKGRQNRWASYFSGRHDLKEDRVLKGFQMDEAELATLRRQTEILMDNFMSETVKSYEQLFHKRLPMEALTEGTTTSDIATFTNLALPLIRKIWPRLFANQIVSVQPMRGPTTRAHTLDFDYCSSGETYSSGTSIYPNEDPDYSNDPGECAEPNELCLSLTAATITAVTKKLKAEWSEEASQDLASQYGLNLNNEVSRMMGMQIEREINREIITAVDSCATTNTTWTSTQPSSPNPWANATPRQYAESIFDAICDADNQIFTRVYEHGNFILCGATFANRLRKLNSFRSLDTTAGNSRVVTGPNLFGVLSEQYRCYHDPFYTADKAIVGHKSGNWMYTGYVYLPYVPLWSTPVIWNTKMCPAKGVMSRYGKYCKNGDFYATVTVV